MEGALLERSAFLALDDMNLKQAIAMMELTKGRFLGYKAEALLFCDVGPKTVIRTIKGYSLAFADAKIHRIPSTAAEETAYLASYGADLITVQSSGGVAMMAECVKRYRAEGPDDGLGILPITVLTSLSPIREDKDSCYRIYGNDTGTTVYRLAAMAEEAGTYGVVCSAQELTSLKGNFLNLKRATPGTRSKGKNANDQKRVTTPRYAIDNGADLLVIGRQVTASDDPIGEIDRIEEELAVAA